MFKARFGSSVLRHQGRPKRAGLHHVEGADFSGLSVVPEEGLEVVVTGRLTAFGAQSKYNMNVDEVAVAGQGALMALLEKRKKQLEAEGLFRA